MSYEIVKSIVITKNKQIFITSACNNVRPLWWNKWEYRSRETFEETLFWLFKDILDGNLHLQSSVNPRIKNAIMINRIGYNHDCYKNADRVYIEKANEEFNLKPEDYENEWKFESAVKSAYNTKHTREEINALYEWAQHQAYDDLINPMIGGYINDLVDYNKYVVKIDNCRYLTKMNQNTYRYCWDKAYAKRYDLYDAWENSQFIHNSVLERA